MRGRKLPETHRFLSLLVCDWCGHKITFSPDARTAMAKHLAAEHPQSRYAPGTTETTGETP